MNRKNINSKEGFTIIEVVLVLAIAGLIFLMVFIALPALQRSQRDTQRRDDMARFLSQLNQYQANNSGRVPTDYGDFISDYLEVGGDTFNDPSTGETYTIASKITDCSDSNEKPNCAAGKNAELSGTMGEINVYTNAKCEGEDAVYIQGDRKIAIRIKLEGAGVYCGNS